MKWLALTLFFALGCNRGTTVNKNKKGHFSSYDEICLRGVTYYVHTWGNQFGMAPAYNTDGNLIECQRITNGTTRPTRD